MDIALTGSSGLIGKALASYFTTEGHTVHQLKRDSSGEYEPLIEGCEVVINLAGAPVACRWSDAKKKEILSSRVNATKVIAEKAARMERPPKIILNASAIGIYGDKGDQTVDELSPRGHGFLADVVEQWEQALEPARQAGIRTVSLRFGVVLSRQGGALSKMLLPFKLGLGGKIGSGKQFMSWIALEDVVGAIDHVLSKDELEGPVNIVAPFPVRNEEFTETLGHVLHRPTVFAMPSIAVKLLFGQMGEEMLLGGAKVEPSKLLETGYPFLFPKLSECLHSILGR